MSAKISGYVVVCNDQGMILGRDGVLWYGTARTPATRFASRKDATKAIQRTETYALEQGLDWAHARAKVVPVGQ